MSRQIQVFPHPKKPGVVVTCECGWMDHWVADDGSAEQSAALHKCMTLPIQPPKGTPHEQTNPHFQ
jgi:hypothetical protein